MSQKRIFSRSFGTCVVGPPIKCLDCYVHTEDIYKYIYIRERRIEQLERRAHARESKNKFYIYSMLRTKKVIHATHTNIQKSETDTRTYLYDI